MAHAVSRRPLSAAAWVRAQANPVGFVVDKVSLGQVFLRVPRFSPVNIIPPRVHFSENSKKYIFHSLLHSSSSWNGQKAPKSGRSPVRRQSHPHNQNTRIITTQFYQTCFRNSQASSAVIVLYIFIQISSRINWISDQITARSSGQHRTR
jgi:hypothetical protein